MIRFMVYGLGVRVWGSRNYLNPQSRQDYGAKLQSLNKW